MHNTSALWDELFANPDHWKIVIAKIAGVTYAYPDIQEMTVSGQLFQSPIVGRSISRQLHMVFLPKSEIPRMAKIELYCQLTDGAKTTDVIHKGVFYIDTRSTDTETGWMTIDGYDAIMMMEQVYNGPSSNAVEAMEYIAGQIHTSISVKTKLNPYPIYGATGEMTMRNVANYIAGLHGGNWTVTDTGRLFLMPLAQTVSVLGDETETAIAFGDVVIIA